MKTSTRRVVVAGLVAAQLLTVVLVVGSTGRLSSQAEDDHTVSLLQRAAAEAVDHTRDYVAPAGALVATTADMIDGGSVDRAALERAFLGELARTPQLSGVYVGGDDGSFFFVTREDGGYLVKTITGDLDPQGRTVVVRRIAADGTESAPEVVTDDTYDPRDRPWFQDAARLRSTEVDWTAPYVFFTSAQLGVTASAAVETEAGSLAVVGADIELGSLSGFLATLRIGPTGSAVIVDASSRVIAHPDTALLRQGEGDEATTVAIGELDDARARAAVGSIIAAGEATDERAAGFSSPVGDGQVAYRRLTLGEQMWTVAVHANEGALVRDLREARDDERLLMLAVGLISVVILAIVALPATRPLSRLERRATVDPLSGLLNRETILERGAQIAREPGLHAAIMVDLDRFKLVNDTHGHQIGDEVIHDVGQRITGVLRSTDRAGRIGGEEFLVLLTDTTPEQATEVAERLRQAIRGNPVATTIGQLEVTASVGLGLALGPSDLQRTLAVADTALMEAKHEGRDRLVTGGLAGAQPTARD